MKKDCFCLVCSVLNQTGQSPSSRFFRGNKKLLTLIHSCRAKEYEIEYTYGELKSAFCESRIDKVGRGQVMDPVSSGRVCAL